MPFKIQKDPTFHLIWTTKPTTFKERNFDVLEAYFYHHPNATMYIYATYLHSDMFERFSKSGYKIEIIPIDDTFIHNLSDKCPGKSWLANLERWKQGPFYYSHIADYIRFCLLYTKGGIYSDFDAILLNPINEHDNFIGMDSAGSECTWCLPGKDAYLVTCI